MKRSIKALGVCLLAGTAAVTVTGCGKVNKDYDVYFFNQKSEIADISTLIHTVKQILPRI